MYLDIYCIYIILYIYILELFNKIAKQEIETWWSCWEWRMWCVSLLKESSFTKSTFKSFEWEPGQAFKPRHLFIWKKVKKTRVVDSIRFDSSDFPFFASENQTKAYKSTAQGLVTSLQSSPWASPPLAEALQTAAYGPGPVSNQATDVPLDYWRRCYFV